VDETVAHVVRAVALAALATLGVAAIVSWWLIRSGMRPVDRMIETAAAIAAGDLSRRVPDADPHTELGKLGTALNEMLSQIERSTAARAASEERMRRFVADAAHELRTPLTSLKGHAELYRQGALATPESVARAMGRIESSAGRMGRLVEDLLLLARLDQQRALEREPVDLVALAAEAAADFATLAPDHPFAQQLDGEAVVLGDRIRLRQVIDNLLANARTHTPATTPVRLTVRRCGQAAEMVVADEGPGIPPEAQERVFERFWRADPGRTRKRGGTGLGLAIVASIVAAHGGTVDLASAPGRGAAFTVRLPLAS
jgi:two-component system OmpR family sensor kinase